MTEYELSNEYLVHHGILGQKWGIRRYQNPDGTLTEAGKKKARGNRVTQKKMTNPMREEYAKNRIKNSYNDPHEAINSEIDKSRRTIKALTAKLKVGHIGLPIAAIAVGGGLGNYPAAAAIGAAWIANFIATPMEMESKARNSQRNIDAIKRVSGIADYTVGERTNNGPTSPEYKKK